MNGPLLYLKFPPSFWSFEKALDLTGAKALQPSLSLVTVAAPLGDSKLVDRNCRSVSEAETGVSIPRKTRLKLQSTINSISWRLAQGEKAIKHKIADGFADPDLAERRPAEYPWAVLARHIFALRRSRPELVVHYLRRALI